MILLSPAKSLRFDGRFAVESSWGGTTIQFPFETTQLASVMSKVSASELVSLMNISTDLAELNHQRFKNFILEMPMTDPQCRAALFAFNGDAFEGIQPETMLVPHLEWLSKHLRILSGFYGLLRPGDLIRAYRLEMGRKPKGLEVTSLYEFWNDKLAQLLLQDLQKINEESQSKHLIINLASDEYSKAILPSLSKQNPNQIVIQPKFESKTASGWKVVSFNAKRARGLLTRYLAENSASNKDLLKILLEFNQEGWSLHQSDATSPIFRKNSI